MLERPLPRTISLPQVAEKASKAFLVGFLKPCFEFLTGGQKGLASPLFLLSDHLPDLHKFVLRVLNAKRPFFHVWDRC